jgi:energy-coupling factor transporter ATP-binding protein EcfA2
MGTALDISRDLELELEEIIGQCVAILGIRGSGKSNTAGVIFEELLRHRYPMSIVDIEGEYFGLKERYEVLVVGTGDGVEIEIDADCAGEIAQVSMEQNVPVVLDLSGFLSDERTELLKAYLSSLWNLAGTLRRPYIIGIEEAHEFIPQGVKNELKEMIARIALRGRKRGLGAIIVSQRSAKVDKDVLSQAGMLFLHRVVHEVDMRVYGELLPWRKNEVKEIVNSLDTGDCIYMNGDRILPIYVRERQTFHAGFTPSLESVKSPELRKVSESIIEAIEKARGGKRRKSAEDELRDRIARLEEMLASKDDRIAELEEVARTLGYIKLELPPSVAPALTASGPTRGTALPYGSYRPMIVREEPESEVPADPSEEPPIDAIGELEMPRSIGDLPPAVLRHVDRLVSRIERRTVVHKRLLGFLVSHAPGTYSVDQISAWTGCASEMIEEAPPRELIEAGLICRERRTDGVHYRGALRAFVNREFEVYQPDIGTTGLHAVTQMLRGRLAPLAERA